MAVSQQLGVIMGLLSLTALVGAGVGVGSAVGMMTMAMAEEEQKQQGKAGAVAASPVEKRANMTRGFAASKQ